MSIGNGSDYSYQRADGRWVFVWFSPHNGEIELGTIYEGRVDFIKINPRGITKRDDVSQVLVWDILKELSDALPERIQNDMISGLTSRIERRKEQIRTHRECMEEDETFRSKLMSLAND